MLARLMGLGKCTEYDANNVCIQIPDVFGTGDPLRAEPPAPTVGVVPVSRCPWYTKPAIGATDLECQFPSNAVLLLGAAGIGVLIFLSVRS